jgi:anti-sigma regulatory factor (Ser/Thr protein kinase)
LIFNRTIPSEKESAKKIIADALAYLSEVKEAGLAKKVSELDYRFVLDEAVENALKHANCFDPLKKITVSVKPYKFKVSITITDEGKGFHVDSLPDPTSEENIFKFNGRGVYIIKCLYKARWTDGGRRLKVDLPY